MNPNDRVTCIKTAVSTYHSSSQTLLFVGLCTLSGSVDNDYCSGSLLVFNLSALQITGSPVPLKTYKVIDTLAPIMQMDIMEVDDKDKKRNYLVVAKATRHHSSSASMVSLFDLHHFRESKAFELSNYISTLTVVKAVILVGDIYNGLKFLFYKVRVRRSYHVGRRTAGSVL